MPTLPPPLRGGHRRILTTMSDRLRHAHAVLTLVWLLLAIPSIIWWKDSVPWLVAVSVYANVVGHASGWQASRAERAADSTS